MPKFYRNCFNKVIRLQILNTKNYEGSIMILLVLVIAVMALLGTLSLRISNINYKMRITNSKVIENSYMSESGIDEGYALAICVYDQIYTESENYISDLISSINIDINDIACGKIYYIDSEYTKFIDVNNKLVKSAVDNNFRAFFEKRYIEEINSRFNSFSSKINSKIELDANINNFHFHNSIIELKSKYMDNSITRCHKARLTVKSPTIECEYINVDSTYDSPPYNPLLSKPAFIQKNIYFKGETFFNGDMVVLGNMIDTANNSHINFASNNLAVYGNNVEETSNTGSIRLGFNSSINNINNLYTNTVMYNNKLYTIPGSQILGVDASNIFLNSSNSIVQNNSLCLGVAGFSEEYISNMMSLLKNIHLNPKNSVKDEKIDFNKAHPVQLLYDIRIGGNNKAINSGFVSDEGNDYIICSTNENIKSVYIFGDPYFYGKNKNDKKDRDIDNKPLNIKARDIASRDNIIYTSSEDSGLSLRGIIVSAGDIHILGNVNFEGSIISMGNLYLEGDGVKRLTNNYNTHLAEKLEKSGDKFYGAFKNYYKFAYENIDIENLNDIVRIYPDKEITLSNWRIDYGQ